MSNTSELESINSVCTTAEELIKSEDFMRWVTIILEKVKTFNKDSILSLFIKLQSWDDLDDEEREDLNSFVSDTKVARLWQDLLSKLGNVSNKAETKNQKETKVFSNFLEEILSENWFKKVQSYVWGVAKITDLILDEYAWMKKMKIEVNWEEKEIWLDEENLKVDSSEWKEKEIAGTKVKINEEWDITEFLEWELAWEQLFTCDAAMREVQKRWKRLPFVDDENREFQAIIDKVWVEEFMKLFPGDRYYDWNWQGETRKTNFWGRGSYSCFWSSSSGGKDMPHMIFFEDGSNSRRYWYTKTKGFSVRCIRD